MRNRILIIFITFFIIGCVSSSARSSAKDNLKILIPFYIYPDDRWDSLIDLKRKNPTLDITAIVNQSNGDFTTIDNIYKRRIGTLISTGIKVIGYVYTKWANRSIKDVKTNIDNWAAFYSGISGVFFDEASVLDAKIPYYQALTSYAKDRNLTFTVLNPGTTISQAYIDHNISSVVIIFEDSYSKLKSETISNRPNSSTKLGILVYDVDTEDSYEDVVKFAKENNIDYVYITNDGGINPWDSLSNYYK